MDSEAPLPRLDYSPPPLRRNRRRFYRWSILTAILVAAFFCRDWPVAAFRYVRVAYLQQQCLKHPIPAGVVVYSAGKPDVSTTSPQLAALYGVYPVHPFWLPALTHSTIFLGELRTTNGLHRIVSVEAGVERKSNRFDVATFFATSAELGRTDSSRFNGGGQVSNLDITHSPPVPEAVITSATLDPVDASHIWFTVRLFDNTERWDGRLGHDGNFVLTPTLVPIAAVVRSVKTLH